MNHQEELQADVTVNDRFNHDDFDVHTCVVQKQQRIQPANDDVIRAWRASGLS